ncbi:antitoxin ParD1/3/4 [Rhizobium sp. BK049]|nr:antitoxin ParD1/3/4 [Rhizobium sp. BK049]
MSVKSSISLTDQQDAFARSLVESGRDSSMNSVLQQGLELLRQRTESETAETAALRELVQRRLNGPMTSWWRCYPIYAIPEHRGHCQRILPRS